MLGMFLKEALQQVSNAASVKRCIKASEQVRMWLKCVSFCIFAYFYVPTSTGD